MNYKDFKGGVLAVNDTSQDCKKREDLNSKVLISTDNLDVLEECVWPCECDLCKNKSTNTIIFKNNQYGYNKRIVLCKEHYEGIMKDLKNI